MDHTTHQCQTQAYWVPSVTSEQSLTDLHQLHSSMAVHCITVVCITDGWGQDLTGCSITSHLTVTLFHPVTLEGGMQHHKVKAGTWSWHMYGLTLPSPPAKLVKYAVLMHHYWADGITANTSPRDLSNGACGINPGPSRSVPGRRTGGNDVGIVEGDSILERRVCGNGLNAGGGCCSKGLGEQICTFNVDY